MLSILRPRDDPNDFEDDNEKSRNHPNTNYANFSTLLQNYFFLSTQTTRNLYRQNPHIDYWIRRTNETTRTRTAQAKLAITPLSFLFLSLTILATYVEQSTHPPCLLRTLVAGRFPDTNHQLSFSSAVTFATTLVHSR
jgi:hypothetical protein